MCSGCSCKVSPLVLSRYLLFSCVSNDFVALRRKDDHHLCQRMTGDFFSTIFTCGLIAGMNVTMIAVIFWL